MLFRWLYQEGGALEFLSESLEFLSECLWGHEAMIPGIYGFPEILFSHFVDLGEYRGQVRDGGDGHRGPGPDVGLAGV